MRCPCGPSWIRRGRGRRNVADGDHTVGTVGFVFAVGVAFGKAVVDPTYGEIVKSV